MLSVPTNAPGAEGGGGFLTGPWGALAGAGIGQIGSMLNSSMQKKALSRQLKLQRAAMFSANEGYSAAIAKHNIGTGQMLEAFKGAQTTMGTMNTKGWQNIVQNQQAAVADKDGMLGQRGTFTSSVADNARRGIYNDTSSQLQALDETIGRMAQAAGIQEAQAKHSAYTQGAQMISDRGATIAKMLGDMANTWGGVEYQFDAASVGKGIGSFISGMWEKDFLKGMNKK